MTEAEARTKACPMTFARDPRAMVNPPLCIASACMAWRATKPIISRASLVRLDDDMPTDELELSQRTIHILARMDLRTVGDIRRTSDQTFLRTDNCGRKSLNELREQTGAYNGGARPSEQQPTGFCGLAGEPR